MTLRDEVTRVPHTGKNLRCMASKSASMRLRWLAEKLSQQFTLCEGSPELIKPPSHGTSATWRESPVLSSEETCLESTVTPSEVSRRDIALSIIGKLYLSKLLSAGSPNVDMSAPVRARFDAMKNKYGANLPLPPNPNEELQLNLYQAQKFGVPPKVLLAVKNGLERSQKVKADDSAASQSDNNDQAPRGPPSIRHSL